MEVADTDMEVEWVSAEDTEAVTAVDTEADTEVDTEADMVEVTAVATALALVADMEVDTAVATAVVTAEDTVWASVGDTAAGMVEDTAAELVAVMAVVSVEATEVDTEEGGGEYVNASNGVVRRAGFSRGSAVISAGEESDAAVDNLVITNTLVSYIFIRRYSSVKDNCSSLLDVIILLCSCLVILMLHHMTYVMT